MMCECEHANHFTDKPAITKLVGHEYGKDCPAGVTVKTPFGHFTVCQDCSNTCYKQYPVIAGIQK